MHRLPGIQEVMCSILCLASLSLRFGHEIIPMAILSLPLIQVGNSVDWLTDWLHMTLIVLTGSSKPINKQISHILFSDFSKWRENVAGPR